VYCGRHRPPLLRRKLQIREKKHKDEISRFCIALNKFVCSTHGTRTQPHPFKHLTKRERKDHEKFLTAIKTALKNKQHRQPWGITVKRKHWKSKEYQLLSVNKPSRHDLFGKIPKESTIWETINHKNMSP